MGLKKKKNLKNSDDFLKTTQNEIDVGVVCQPSLGG
jgi:hypothetical protein